VRRARIRRTDDPAVILEDDEGAAVHTAKII
jgi:hypothetical protein